MDENQSPGTGEERPPQSWIAGHSWRAFHRAHLHDYGPGATRLWLVVAACGFAALGVCAVRLAHLPWSELVQILGWIAITAIAAAFPIQIPRTKYSIATCDTIVFLLLAIHGTPAAAFAACVECVIGSFRTSSRLSSHIANLGATPTAMAIGGTLFEIIGPQLQQAGLPAAAAHIAALSVGALVYLAISTMALMQIVYLKRGKKLTLVEWFGSTSWVGTLYLVSAVLAGLLSLNAQQFGRSAAVVGVVVIGVSLALLRVHFRRQTAELEVREARAAAAELEAEQNQKRFLAAFTHASIGMAIVSPEGVVLQANQALCALLGYAEAHVLRRQFRELLHPGDAALLERHVGGVVGRRADSFSIELRCLGADACETWVSLHCALFDDHATADAGLIFQLHDISSRRRAEGELLHIAYHDSLTDLANRNCFQERLNVAVEQSRSDRRFSFAVMYLDLDRFKVVNDSLGHPAGDALLKEVARRLNACVRPRDLVARLGGDEFAILLEDTHRHEDAIALADRLLQALDQPVDINGTDVRPLASIGITFSDLGYREPNEMLRDADIAMYKAKADGKGRLVVFDTSLHDQLAHKLQLEADLRRAIDEGSLSLVFQPLFELEPFRLHGFEALARWVHPTRGSISPAVFIALAEEAGCIEGLTRWAIDEAVRQLADWRGQAPHMRELMMHVNVSGKDLSRQQLVPHVRDVLERFDVPAHLLTLEITETTLMQQRELALRTLADLRALGVRLSIDDFGTGYSSLAYLSTLPFDCLKIDRSFVIGMHKSVQNVEIVRTVLSLGRSLNKTVIAEGIETHDQLLRLKELGAPMGQGYLLARPLAAHQVQEAYVEGTVA
jgi:diguanylate cyclase (GGDEF)-like protein/PAS domain S-box-containing protein